MKQKAFTLIEVLIVILIIGTLTTIAIPMFRDMTAKAKLVSAFRDINQYENAFDSFILEYGSSVTSSSNLEEFSLLWQNNKNSYDLPADNSDFSYILGTWAREGTGPQYRGFDLRIKTRKVKGGMWLYARYIAVHPSGEVTKYWVVNEDHPWAQCLNLPGADYIPTLSIMGYVPPDLLE